MYGILSGFRLQDFGVLEVHILLPFEITSTTAMPRPKGGEQRTVSKSEAANAKIIPRLEQCGGVHHAYMGGREAVKVCLTMSVERKT